MEGADATVEERSVVVKEGEVHRGAALAILGVGRGEDIGPVGHDQVDQLDRLFVRVCGLEGFQDLFRLGLAVVVTDHGDGVFEGDGLELCIFLAQGELGGGGAEHQRYAGGGGGSIGEEIAGRNDGAVSHGSKTAADFGRHFVGQGIVLFPRHGLEFLDIAADALQDRRAESLGSHRISRRDGIAAQADHLVDQAFGSRHSQDVADLGTAAGLTHDGHVTRVATEVGDVVVNPLERSQQVKDTDIAGLGEGRVTAGGQVGETEDVQAVVDGNEDDIAFTGQVGAVVAILFDAVAGGETAAVHPHQDRALAPVRGRGPHVEV